jgi:serine/threonine-protein kinase
MSPEQARGRAVDQRTDIWAFGCLLFEMLTGQPAFAGEDVMAVLARVIDRDTDFSSMPGTISPAVRHTIKMCLQKDPNRRISDIRDVRLALEGAFETDLPQAVHAAAAVPLWRRMLPVAAAVLVTAALVGTVASFSLRPAPRPVVRFDYDLPEGEFLRGLGRSVLAVAPDGRRFAYNGANGIFLREMGELEARLIPGTENPSINLFFSADSQSLGWFGTDGRLRRIAISGGAPVVVADGLVQPFGASWAPDGTIYFGQPDGIYRVSANGGEPERIIAAADAELVYGPRLMPDGDALLFTSSPNGFGSETQVVIESLASGERSVLVDGGADAQYVPTGHLVYALEDGLFAVRFDAATRTVAGGPVPLLQGVWRGTGGAPPAAYGIADDGSLMHLELDGILGQVGSVSDIVWVDRAGVEQPIGMEPCVGCLDLSVSPDGTRVALTVLRQGVQGAGANVWIWSFVSNTLSRLTFDAGIQVFPTWSPDSSRIAFRKIDGLYVRPADGTGEDQQLLQEAANMAPYELAATDELLYSRAGEIGGTEDILVLDPASGGEPRALLATAFVESRPALSPDGRWLAYESDETGQREIYVRPYPEVDSGKWQVSTAGGMQPLWSPDGSRLYYLAEEELMEAEVTTEPAFVRQTPQPLFELRDYQIAAGTLRNYDVAADGERFLMMRQGRGAEGASGSFRVIVVQNWVDELERLVPTE